MKEFEFIWIKGPSDEKVERALKTLSIVEIFKKGVHEESMWFIKYAIEHGLDKRGYNIHSDIDNLTYLVTYEEKILKYPYLIGVVFSHEIARYLENEFYGKE